FRPVRRSRSRPRTPNGEGRAVSSMSPQARCGGAHYAAITARSAPQHDGLAVAKKPCDQLDLHRRLGDPLAHDRAANALLQSKCGELCATCADGDEPRPGSEVEAQSNEQVGEPERREQAAQA